METRPPFSYSVLNDKSICIHLASVSILFKKLCYLNKNIQNSFYTTCYIFPALGNDSMYFGLEKNLNEKGLIRVPLNKDSSLDRYVNRKL